MLVLDRQEFFARYWTYSAGEHVTFLGPTKCGKTTLKMQLLNATPLHVEGRSPNGEMLRPVDRAIIVDTKPRNEEVDEFAARFDWPVTPRVPVPWWTRVRYAGWEWDKFVFRPPHARNFTDEGIDKNDDQLRRSIARLALQCYHGKKSVILDSDEMLDWVDLRLQKLMRILWTRGRSMGVGFWGGTQRPFDVPLYAYSQPTHLFLAHDPVKANLDRLKHIGGDDPVKTAGIVRKLPKYWWLYLQPRDGYSCIIRA